MSEETFSSPERCGEKEVELTNDHLLPPEQHTSWSGSTFDSCILISIRLSPSKVRKSEHFLTLKKMI